MTVLLVVFLGFIGAAMGSFVGALTWRIKKKMDFVKGRSECEYCHYQLSVLDLIPIFSWLFLKGKCRYCHKKIGATTLLLEIFVAAAFVLSFVFWPMGEIISDDNVALVQLTLLGLWLVAVVLMSALLVYDWRWRLLPNKLIFPLIAVAAIFAALSNLFVHEYDLLNFIIQIILSMIPITGIYGLIYVFSNGRMIGFGDVKFGIAAGLLLGWKGALLVLVLSNVIGSLLIMPMLLSKKMKMNTQIPFGPFLIGATFVVFLFQPALIDFVTKTLLLI